MKIFSRGFHMDFNAGRLAVLLLAFVVSAGLTGCKDRGMETAIESDGSVRSTSGLTSETAETAGFETGNGEGGTLFNNRSDSPLGLSSSSEERTPTYTLNISGETLPTNWNPHMLRGEENRKLEGLLSAGLYRYEYTDGAVSGVVPFAAAGLPVDVTEGYIGSYGIGEGETNRAYVIPLREDIRWEDGSRITAEDYVKSALYLLDPDASYADSGLFYSENLVLHGAKAYSHQGKHAYSTLLIPENFIQTNYIPVSDFIVAGGVLTLDGAYADIAINIYDGGSFGDRGLDYYFRKGYFKGRNRERYNSVIAGKADENGYVTVTEDVYPIIADLIAVLHGYSDVSEYAEVVGDFAYLEWEEMCYVGTTYRSVSRDELGIFAAGENELVIVLDKPLTGFCLLDALTKNWLVHDSLYSACMHKDGVQYLNTYGTTLETTMSFGPYRLSSFGGGCYTLERNRYFFGYNDPDAKDHYMTDVIDMVAADEATQIELFKNGELDLLYPSGNGTDDLYDGDNVFRKTCASVYFMIFNPDYDNLETAQRAAGENVNKTIMSIPEFRQAMSLALDRNGFCKDTRPGNVPASGLFASKTVGDLETLSLYQCENESSEYKPSQAKMYFNTAYQQAIVYGYLDKDDVVEICVGIPDPEDDFYELGYQFITDSFTQAVKGTLLEGRLRFTRDDTVGTAYAAALRSGQVDMLFGVGWNGSLYDPYGLMEAFTSHSYRYDRSWQAEGALLTLDLSDTSYTASVCDWTAAINGSVVQLTDESGRIVNYSCGRTYGDPEERLMILHALEHAVITQYDMIPLMEKAEVCIVGEQISTASTADIAAYFDDIRYLRFEHADAE